MWGQPAIERTYFSSTETQLEAAVGLWAHRGPQAKPLTSRSSTNCTLNVFTPHLTRADHKHEFPSSCDHAVVTCGRITACSKASCHLPKYKEAARVTCYRASQTCFAGANLTDSLVLFCCTGVQVSCWKQLWPAQQRMASQMQNWDKLVLLD